MNEHITPPVAYGRLNRAQGLELLRDAPLLELGRMAFDRKRDLYGDRVTYIRNLHINPTNLCVYSCAFCDFSAKKGDAHAYEMNEAEILEKVAEPSLREVHIVGGLWPSWNFQRSLNLIRSIRALRPHLWIKAFTAVEVAYFARMERHNDCQVIIGAMMEAGVNQMPGGGAEVLSERVHQALYKDKIGPSQWLEIHEIAHKMGLPSNATLLFGHIETDEEIVEHLLHVRDLQDRTPGFQSFVPLAYQPGKTQLTPRMASAPRCLRIVALARLMLDNVAHIKAYWPSLQVETAVAALNFGADDLDGTLGKERIMQMAGAAAPDHATQAFMERMGRQAGQHLIERDGAYRTLDVSVPAYVTTGA
jgi:aminodeoxyfutalosine synthase